MLALNGAPAHPLLPTSAPGPRAAATSAPGLGSPLPHLQRDFRYKSALHAAGGSLGSLSRKELDALIAEAKKVAKRSVTLLPLAAERAGEWRRTAASDKLGRGPFVHARTRNSLV